VAARRRGQIGLTAGHDGPQSEIGESSAAPTTVRRRSRFIRDDLARPAHDDRIAIERSSEGGRRSPQLVGAPA